MVDGMRTPVRRDSRTRAAVRNCFARSLRAAAGQGSKNTYRKRFLTNVRLDIVLGVLVLLFFADIGNHFQSVGDRPIELGGTELPRAREFI